MRRENDSAIAGTEWVSAMRAGDFERAWTIADRHLEELRGSRDGKYEGPRHLQRIWRGEELARKRVLVRCYHGLGDTIQFIRFVPALRRIAREVVVWCQPELLSLVARVEGVDRAIPLHDGSADISFDVDIEIMEIPHAIRAGRDLVEMRLPYLNLPQSHHPGARAPGQHELAVGVLWQAGDWDRRRAVPATLLNRIGCSGVRLCSLQRGAAAQEASEIGVVDVSTPDIEALGHRLRELDLLVCVDTMIAHLAGALGCETWMMLHSNCDWRWPSVGERTFWYPSIRLFHQRIAGEWSETIEEVRAGILARTGGRGLGSRCREIRPPNGKGFRSRLRD